MITRRQKREKEHPPDDETEEPKAVGQKGGERAVIKKKPRKLKLAVNSDAPDISALKLTKAIRISTILDDLIPETPIPLDHSDAFTLLVAVVLSAQSTDKKVNEITPSLFELASSPEAMAQAQVSDIQRIIKPIGLAPQKAKAIHGLSKMIVEEFKGLVPNTFEDLERLPGVGHKTASVIMAQVWDIPAFPVDTHIHRLATRWGLSSGKSVEETEACLKQIFPQERWKTVHLQIVYFGRQYCPAIGHNLDLCPICSWCASPQMKMKEHKRSTPKTQDKLLIENGQ
mmetsp:Transcript_30917/g.50019  ORF Transcript_30917/g.50019 Transcript_30917/m.50019 type:complete len:285 (+) Transcript_30917:193-1047(+)